MDKTDKPQWKIPWRGLLIALVVSAAVLAVIFWQMVNPRDVLQELRQYPLSYFFGALFFVLAAWLVDGQRIGTLARALGQRIPWWELAIILGAANFLTLVTPFVAAAVPSSSTTSTAGVLGPHRRPRWF